MAQARLFRRPYPPNLFRCRAPLGLDLGRELRVRLSAPEFARPSALTLRMCPRPAPAARRPGGLGVTLCSRPLFETEEMESRFAMLSDWVVYHRALGVDRFVLYDADGSLARIPQLRSAPDVHIVSWPLAKDSSGCLDATPNVTLPWVHSWSPRMGCQDHVFHHCMHQERGLSKWVLLLRAPDKYLVGSSGPLALRRLLEQAEADGLAASVSLLAFDFDGRTTRGITKGAPLISRFLENSPPERNATIPWVQLANPLRVLLPQTHRVTPRHGFRLLKSSSDVWVNHYLSWHGGRRRAPHKASIPVFPLTEVIIITSCIIIIDIIIIIIMTIIIIIIVIVIVIVIVSSSSSSSSSRRHGALGPPPPRERRGPGGRLISGISRLERRIAQRNKEKESSCVHIYIYI